MPARRGACAALTLERRGDGIAVILWDEGAAPEGPRDTAHIEGGLEACLDELARWPALRGLVLACIGSGSSLAGAYIRELRGRRSAAECTALARRTQALATRLSRLPVPSVAALHGPCRGRALAFALAAHARVASGDERTVFAIPEVRLGLVPGGGTTLRLPRLVGTGAALDLMLSGRDVSSATALRLGLVDRLATGERLLEDGVALARSLSGASPPKCRTARASMSRRFREGVLARNPLGRALLVRRVRRRALARTRGNYPAPERLLEVVRGGLSRGFEVGLDLEAQAFGELGVSGESRALLHLYAARDELAEPAHGDIRDRLPSSCDEGAEKFMDPAHQGNDITDVEALAIDERAVTTDVRGVTTPRVPVREVHASRRAVTTDTTTVIPLVSGIHERKPNTDAQGEAESTGAIRDGGPSRSQGTGFEAVRAPESSTHVRPAKLVPEPDRGAGDHEEVVMAGSPRARPINAVGIVGAGPTGAGIVGVSAMHAGVEVRLAGGSAAARERGVTRLRAVLDVEVKSGRLTRARRDAVLERVRPVGGRKALAGVDLVMDAEPGSLDDKRRMIGDLERFENEHLIYASCLASSSVTRLAAASRRPGNVVGMRYSPPVERMPLLEVVAGEQSAPRAVAACVDFGQRQGKTVIVVRDRPECYCSRILAPWFNEALWQLSEGVPIEHIDWALVDFGFPRGPFVRLDDIGIDLGAGAGRALHEAFGERMRPPPAMARLIADGRAGRRSGRGFYSYEIRGRERRGAVDGSVYTAVRAWPAVTRPAAEIAQRCLLAMVNEAAYCLDEGVVRCARDGDVGAVFGVGFPAFLGGPFRYVDALGAAWVVERLESWAVRCGDRFRPAPLLAAMAERAGRFYPEED